MAQQRFDGTHAGTLTLISGGGGMGGAQPLAVTLTAGRDWWWTCETRLRRGVEHRYFRKVANDPDDDERYSDRAHEPAPSSSSG